MGKVKDSTMYGEIQVGEFDVTEDRDKYLGGSDIPAILGISPFTKCWKLLLQKAGLEERKFFGTKYTQYGHDMEPVIRDYVNGKLGTRFTPAMVINGDIRYHADGWQEGAVLEVKTTSTIHETLEEYKMYLVQLALGMQEMRAARGVLAVYNRPKDLSLDFDPDRLQIFEVPRPLYRRTMDEVNPAIDRFRRDLARLIDNPLLSEEDL